MYTYDESFAAVLGAFAIIGVVVGVIALVVYLINAIATYKYLKVRGYANAWFGFIPVLNTYGTVEATYGDVEKIKVWGVELPAIIVKLYPLILAVIGGITAQIDPISGICGTIISVATVLVGIVVFKDVMERIERPVSTGFAVFAVIITIVSSIKLLIDAGSCQPNQFDYKTDTRVLQSQQ